MSCEIIVRHAARKQLDASSDRNYQQAARAISSLVQNPRPLRVKKLADSGLWRVRVGHSRVVYAIDDGASTVTIVRLARRREDTYRGL